MLNNIGFIIALTLILVVLLVIGLMIRRVRQYSKVVKDLKQIANKLIDSPSIDDLKDFMNILEFIPLPNHPTMWDLMRDVLKSVEQSDLAKQQKNKLRRILENKGVNLS